MISVAKFELLCTKCANSLLSGCGILLRIIMLVLFVHSNYRKITKMDEDQRQQQVIGGAKKSSLGKNKKLVVLVVLLMVLVAALVVVATRSSDKKPASQDKSSDSSNTSQEDKAIPIKDTTTLTSQGAMIKGVLSVFKVGGTFNDKKIEGKGYYPSQADMKDGAWLKQNMNIDDSTHALLQSGEVAYESKGCDASKPSSTENACSGYVIKVNGKVVAEE